MANIITGAVNAVKNIVSGKVFYEHMDPVVSVDPNSMSSTQAAATPPAKTMEGIWTSLPKINPRVLAGGNGYTGLIDLELIRNTGATWDPRGEAEAVKKIKSVTIPGFLVNDRNITAAQQRAWMRDAQGDIPFQI